MLIKVQRYFVSQEQFKGDTVEITGEDARHIAKVMRSKEGDTFIVSDGREREALVEIRSIDQGVVTTAVVEMLAMTQEPRVKVTIAQSLPKGDKMETVIQKCTEIGAAAFVPFLSERTIVQYDAKKEEKRIVRWSKIAKEAAEQSHRNRVPEVGYPIHWKNLLASFSAYDAVYFCYEKEHGLQLRDAVKPWIEDRRCRRPAGASDRGAGRRLQRRGVPGGGGSRRGQHRPGTENPALRDGGYGCPGLHTL